MACMPLQMELLDTAGAHECLRGMRIVMLGDSTMTETMHDLVLLLAGLGSRPVQMADIIYKATRCGRPHLLPTRFTSELLSRARQRGLTAAGRRLIGCTRGAQAERGAHRDVGAPGGHGVPFRGPGGVSPHPIMNRVPQSPRLRRPGDRG